LLDIGGWAGAFMLREELSFATEEDYLHAFSNILSSIWHPADKNWLREDGTENARLNKRAFAIDESLMRRRLTKPLK
jgi:hypothetical protein